jgi:Ala-tRNA(Pro) deacylase
MDIYEFLSEHSIGYERHDHPPVFTCEEAQRLVPPMPGGDTKNLLLRDKKGRKHFLVATGYDKKVDLKALSQILSVSNLSFASAERLKKYLGIDPGCVSLLAVVNDYENAVEVIVDEELWKANSLRCHPLVNTSTLVISRADLERIFTITGHTCRVLAIPEVASHAGDV